MRLDIGPGGGVEVDHREGGGRIAGAEIGQRRNEEGATLADKRTSEFFAKHLA